MSGDDSIEWDRTYTDAEVAALQTERRPQPQRPFPLDAPVPAGTGHSRRSTRGDKWCAYCQTPLNRTQRALSCTSCRARRVRALDAARTRPSTAAEPTESEMNYRDIMLVLEGIDEMNRVVGVAYSMRARNGGIKVEHVEDMLVACKDVSVAADALRRRLTPPRRLRTN